MDQVTWQDVVAILALFGGPTIAIIGWWSNRRKITADVHLVEAKTMREWNAARKELEKELERLSGLLRDERNGRREDRERFLKRIAELEFTYQQTIASLQEKLQICVEALTAHDIKIDGIEDWPELN
jgi:hypothetical protein